MGTAGSYMHTEHADRRAPRRSHSITALLIGVVVLFAACGSDGDGTDSGAAKGEWAYVDGSGRETSLDEVPERIVAHASAAAALIPLGIRPVGIFADTSVDEDLALSHIDLDGIEIVGEEWGNINVEAVAALEPDLIVADYWPLEDAYQGMEDGDGSVGERMRDIAPVVGVTQGPSILTMIEDYEALAASLGADLDGSEVTADRSAFEEARANFEAAAAAKPGLSVLAVSPTPEGLYVAVPEHAAELSDLASWGLDIVVPDTPDEGFEYWETLSWENVDKYQADLLIVDERGYPENVEEARRHPSWLFLDAAATDAVAVWPAFWLRNHGDYAEALEQLTAAIEAADENLVP